MCINERGAQLVVASNTFALGGSVFEKDAILDAGGFREIFRFASEDTDLAERLTMLGYKLHLLQSAVFYHYSRPTWKALFRQYKAWGKNWATIEKTYVKETLRERTLILNFFDISFGILVSSRDILKAYKATNDKRCILLPLNFVFKRSAWTIGYLFNFRSRPKTNALNLPSS